MLLKLLQEDLNARFVETTGDVANLDHTTRRAALDELSAEQGRLAELSESFAEKEPQSSEEDLDTLPDYRDEE